MAVSTGSHSTALQISLSLIDSKPILALSGQLTFFTHPCLVNSLVRQVKIALDQISPLLLGHDQCILWLKADSLSKDCYHPSINDY